MAKQETVLRQAAEMDMLREHNLALRAENERLKNELIVVGTVSDRRSAQLAALRGWMENIATGNCWNPRDTAKYALQQTEAQPVRESEGKL